ncbi:unnamed protein product [Amoebophrya sp. A120]|nr:unnamed protein product [Amoebophrya sp. A120]|eukprot:GSA120T00005367001.1
MGRRETFHRGCRRRSWTDNLVVAVLPTILNRFICFSATSTVYFFEVWKLLRFLTPYSFPRSVVPPSVYAYKYHHTGLEADGWGDEQDRIDQQQILPSLDHATPVWTKSSVQDENSDEEDTTRSAFINDMPQGEDSGQHEQHQLQLGDDVADSAADVAADGSHTMNAESFQPRPRAFSRSPERVSSGVSSSSTSDDPSKESQVTLFQWNLLATGLHQDGFVRPDLFPGEKMQQHLDVTRKYRALMQEHNVDLELLKHVQPLWNKALFGEDKEKDNKNSSDAATKDVVQLPEQEDHRADSCAALAKILTGPVAEKLLLKNEFSKRDELFFLPLDDLHRDEVRPRWESFVKFFTENFSLKSADVEKAITKVWDYYLRSSTKLVSSAVVTSSVTATKMNNRPAPDEVEAGIMDEKALAQKKLELEKLSAVSPSVRTDPSTRAETTMRGTLQSASSPASSSDSNSVPIRERVNPKLQFNPYEVFALGAKFWHHEFCETDYGSELLQMTRKAWAIENALNSEAAKARRLGELETMIATSAGAFAAASSTESLPSFLTLQEVAPSQFLLVVSMKNHAYLKQGAPATSPADESSTTGSDQQTTATFDELQKILRRSKEEEKDDKIYIKRLNEDPVLTSQFSYVLRPVGPTVIGTALFVDPKRFEVVKRERVKDFAVIATVRTKRNQGGGTVPGNKVQEAAAKIPPPSTFAVVSAHLASGVLETDFEDRVEQVADLLETLNRPEYTAIPVLLGMDGNFDRKVDMIKVRNGDHFAGSWDAAFADFEQWEDVSVGKKHEKYLVSRNQEVQVDSLKADNGFDEHPVTVNRLRGMFSSQVKKWGDYQLRNIDYVMVRNPKRSVELAEVEEDADKKAIVAAPPALFLHIRSVLNSKSLQAFPIKNTLLKAVNLDDILEADKETPLLGGMLPNGENPSDHAPVAVRFEMQYGES